MSSRPAFSRRFPWEQPQNRLTRAVEERATRGLPTIDLTETNPTRVGLPYPEAELADLLRRGAAASYQPDPRGLLPAREALAGYLSAARPEDLPVSPDDLLLTASTSESYSYLFKLFADPGDQVLAPVPSYPLLDSLAALDGLDLAHFPLKWRGRFAVDLDTVELALSPRTRLLALVHPGHPTGSFLTVRELEEMGVLCASRGLPLLSDEVFADYPLDSGGGGEHRAGPAAAGFGEGLTFSLGGLSKSAGLPGWKLGWIRVGGPAGLRRRALAALEMVADSYLSLATPVQQALPGVLALAPAIRGALLDRLRGNLSRLREAVAGVPGVELFEPEGGWSAVLRVTSRSSDEELVLGLLESTGILVQPGYFYDFVTDDFLVLSLLPAPDRFALGVGRLAGFLGERSGENGL
ncbi:MAG TPA: pyridoxal phosphate-dependent aminotransferase [Thermoanaerobaculia bacterium]|nr:pyridoxal phosphate-dependent aminotransferase [Thermoanaerobaculia bacterium]